MDLEKIATASVTASISVTDVLSPFINDGDKEPSWDGNIYIYSNKDKKKDRIKRVPVQIKGKQNDDFSKETIKYPITVIDLENYLNDGGVLFFVVYIGNTGINTKIYYSCLLPIKLRSMLNNNVNGKKRLNVVLKPFPEDNMAKVSVLLNFYDHRQRQTSFSGSNLRSLEELEKQGVLEGITLSVTNYGNPKSDQYKMLFQDDIYLYANIKGSAVPQPLADIPMDLHIFKTIETDISVNGVIYYTQFQMFRSRDKIVLTIGKSFTISKMEKEQNLTIKFTPTPILKYSVTDLEFILALHKYSQFEMSGHALPIDSGKMFSIEMFEKLEQNLEYCRNLIRVMDIFKLDTGINMNNLSAEDYRNNDRLIRGLLNNEPISGLRADLPFVVKLNYLGTKVIIGLNKENKSGTYRISDYFSNPQILYYKDDDKMHRTSKYDFLKADDFLVFRNIDYDDVLSSYQELSDEINIYERANFMLLELLDAYDKSEDTRKDILNAAYNFAEWLHNANIGETDLACVIRTLNFYQVLKRQGKLTKTQKKELFCLAEDIHQCKEVRIGANLLIDNQLAAEILFDELSDDLKEEFRKFPIFRFWEDTVEK